MRKILLGTVLLGCGLLAAVAIADDPPAGATDLNKPESMAPAAESFRKGWTPELVRVAIDGCSRRVFEQAFAAYRQRNGLPPPSASEIAKQRELTYFLNHQQEVDTETVKPGGKCAPKL